MSVQGAFKASAHHKHQRVLSEDLIKHFSTISPDSSSSCQHTTFTWSLYSWQIYFFPESFTDYRMFLFAFVHLSSSTLAFSFKKNKPTKPNTQRAINKLLGQDTEGVFLQGDPFAWQTQCGCVGEENKHCCCSLHLNSRRSTKLPAQRWAPGNPSPTALTFTVQLPLKISPGFNF